MNDVMYEIFNEMLKQKAKKKLDKNISLEDYLKVFTEKELKSKMLPSYILGEDVGVIICNNKKNTIKYIIENLEELITYSLYSLDPITYKDLEKIINEKEISINRSTYANIDLSLVGNIYFDKKQPYIFIQKDILKIIKKIMNSKIKKYILIKERIYEIIRNSLNIYGVMTKEELLECLDFYEIKYNKKDIDKYVMLGPVADGGFEVTQYENDLLLYNLNLNEEEAVALYEKLKDKSIYLSYSEQELKEFNDQDFLYGLKSYEKLIDYLTDYYELDKESIESINEMIILNFLYTANYDLESAIDNLKNNISNSFEIQIQQLNKITNMIISIYNDYPKWNKRGEI